MPKCCIIIQNIIKRNYVNWLVLVDGIPVGTDNISTLNLDNTTQVEVLTGPFSSFFGTNAMGGIVNMTTKRSTEQ